MFFVQEHPSLWVPVPCCSDGPAGPAGTALSLGAFVSVPLRLWGMSSLGAVVVPDTDTVFLLDLLFPCPGLKGLWDWLTLAPQAGASLLAISSSEGFQTQTSSGWRVYQLVPLELTYNNWGACLRGAFVHPPLPHPAHPASLMGPRKLAADGGS